jgi:hypothetical protein
MKTKLLVALLLASSIASATIIPPKNCSGLFFNTDRQALIWATGALQGGGKNAAGIRSTLTLYMKCHKKAQPTTWVED